MTFKTCTIAVAAAAALAVSAALSQADDSVEATRNTNIDRMVSGVHSFYEKEGATLRGREWFRMIVHQDGTRTMNITKDTFGTNRQHTIFMRVDEQFRPLEAYGMYRYPDGERGSVRVAVDGDLLTAQSFSPTGHTTHEVRVPPALAVVTHGEGLNSWSASVLDPDSDATAEPASMERTSYFISPPKDAPGPVLGKVTRSTLKRIGEETITVPAGTFETVRYSTGPLEIWAMKGDRILVKQTYFGEDYVLTEYNAE